MALKLNYPFANSWWIAPGEVLGGPYPAAHTAAQSRQRLGALLDIGVRCIINLQEPNELGGGGKPFFDYEPLLTDLARTRGAVVSLQRFAIRDVGVPNRDLMCDILRAIRDRLADGGRVYVHCWGGHGRTATVAGCWYRELGLSGEQALHRISEAREDDRYLRTQSAPESAQQRDFMQNWQPFMKLKGTDP